jgi:hypothetical protein
LDYSREYLRGYHWFQWERALRLTSLVHEVDQTRLIRLTSWEVQVDKVVNS